MESYSIQDLENKLKTDKEELLEVESLLEEDNDAELQKLKDDLIAIIKTTTDLIFKKKRELDNNNNNNNNVNTQPPIIPQTSNSNININSNSNGNSNNNNYDIYNSSNYQQPQTQQQQIEQFSEDNSLTVGTVCEAQYSVDGVWYKAVIDSINKDGTFIVTYPDYGNSEVLTFDKIKPPTRSQKLLLNQNLEQKKYLQAPDTIQSIPKHLRILPEDNEETRKQKEKRIRSIKSMNRLKKVEEEGKQKTQAWKDFLNKPKRSVPGTFTDKKKGSMFSTSDSAGSKVGVIGSGRGMTESQQFQGFSKKAPSQFQPPN
ncbi:hypothetical protein DICPUDRAFT_150386 [Dictyostelium purpureum]|uniref:Tudor domain-containing protein n=1 Tax=Dictyostelium purpureum TaxID=5786 RepID=F0ZG72_DICPU|nr:uncharacterized protein DICPUDRAFT_150386 [Dictyostelium purpureum]EGC37069.1 hypothetical protein DICPUDRAFT_150386 [Dictyostelium purpureum]|eukprot:XP_003286426.1 hypothetical protein DICPUDRAFT_150386 [Dictyostelium purpureum]